MRKNKKIILLALLLFVSLGIVEYFGMASILPVLNYQEKTEPINLGNVCQKIKGERFKKLCFDIVKENDFQKGLVLVDREEGSSIKYYPWYDAPFTGLPNDYHNFPGGMKALLNEGRKYDSKEWCKNVYLSYTPLQEDYYLCRAFLENPNFCGKVHYPIGPSKGVCYQDAAFIWRDPSFCRKAKYQDFCYIRVVLGSLEDSENE